MTPAERTSSSRAVRTGRWMATREEPFTVFVFGMRLNRLRGLPRFVWGLRVLRSILRDLDAHPEHGFLAGRVYRVGRTLIAVQYWESFDALDAWARDHRLPHRKPWQRYLREALGDEGMGLWHETYLASPGTWGGSTSTCRHGVSPPAARRSRCRRPEDQPGSACASSASAGQGFPEHGLLARV